MKRIYLLYSLISVLFFSCKTKTVDVTQKLQKKELVKNYSYITDSLIKHIKVLSSDAFKGRRTGTEGAFKAKTYIIEAYSKLGVMPLGIDYEQHFTFKSRSKSYQGANVLGLIKGTKNDNEYIVLSAHYDHEGVKNGEIYNGADDDASGVSALIAFADYLRNNPPKYNVILAAFDAEELGLKGAHHYVENSIVPKESIKLNLNMDMISRSNKNELFAVGSRYYPHLKPAIENFIDIGRVNLLIGHEGLDKEDNWTNASDHAAFHKANIPFIYFGVADHEDYHKPTDDFERIDKLFYKDAVQTIIRMFEVYDKMTL